MGTISPEQERSMLLGCTLMLASAVVVVGAIGYAGYKLIGALFS